MYSMHEASGDRMKRKQYDRHSEGKENNWSSFEKDNCSASSSFVGDFGNFTRNSPGFNEQEHPFRPFTQKSPMPSSNGFLRNAHGQGLPSHGRTNYGNVNDSLHESVFRERFWSNNADSACPGCRAEAAFSSRPTNSRTNKNGLGDNNEMPRGRRSKEKDRLKHSNVREETKGSKLNEQQADKNDINKDGSQQNRFKNTCKGPKRPHRSKIRPVHKKPGNLAHENSDSIKDDVDGTTAVLFTVLRKVVLQMLSLFPICIRTGYVVIRYLLLLAVLALVPLLYCGIMCVKWIPMFILNKARALKTDFDAFSKRRTVGNTPPDYKPEPNFGGKTLSADEVVSKLLAARDLDAYGVLGVSRLATDDEIKRKYREMAKIVHPDKNAHEDAGEAFQILQSAFEMINDEEKRMAYQFETNKKKVEEEFEDFLDLMKRHVDEIRNRIMCSVCDKTHPRLLTDRLVSAARYCAQCNVRHSAKEGDVWVETSHMGFKYYCYLCMEKQVFEVTEWAACQGLLNMRANTHSVYFSVKSNRRSSPWDDLFGDSEQAPPSNQNKKKRNKGKAKASGKSKKR